MLGLQRRLTGSTGKKLSTMRQLSILQNSKESTEDQELAPLELPMNKKVCLNKFMTPITSPGGAALSPQLNHRSVLNPQ